MRVTIFVLLGLLLMSTTSALAHRVNIFAYVQGQEVFVECSFSKSNRVRHGQIEVYAAGLDELLLRGETDDQGLFSFPVPPRAVELGADLRIVLWAGEGHQNEWTVPASEFTSIPATLQGLAPVQSQAAPQRDLTTATAVSPAELEAMLGAMLDAKLAPIKRLLLEQIKTGPGLIEIIGGIGWIFGLVGVAAYFKGRPRV